MLQSGELHIVQFVLVCRLNNIYHYMSRGVKWLSSWLQWRHVHTMQFVILYISIASISINCCYLFKKCSWKIIISYFTSLVNQTWFLPYGSLAVMNLAYKRVQKSYENFRPMIWIWYATIGCCTYNEPISILTHDSETQRAVCCG